MERDYTKPIFFVLLFFAFILLGFLLYHNLSDRMILLIAMIMSLFGSLVRHVDFNNSALNIIMGHIIGTEEASDMVMSDFPLMNWFLVPAVGYIFGKYLIRLKDKKTFYSIITPIPFVVCTAFFIVEYKLEFGQMAVRDTLVQSENCYYHLLWYDAVALSVFAVSIMGVYYAIMKVTPAFLKRFIVSLSRNITRVYVIHWFFVVLFTNVILYVRNKTQELPIGPTLLLSALIFLITYPLALLWERMSIKKKGNK